MKTIKILLFAAFFAALLPACKRDEAPDRLPKETISGKNTFGCKINGKVWVPINDMEYGPGSEDFSVSWGPDGKSAWVKAVNYHGENRERLLLRLENIPVASAFRLEIKNKFKEGINVSSCNLSDSKNGAAPSIQYHTSPTRTGWVEITRLDTVARIIAGRFEFSMQMEGGDSVLNVTDGRFDIKF